MSTVNPKQLKIAKRYASALAKLDSRDEVYYDLQKVEQVFKESAELREFLENPIITVFDKKDVMSKVFSDLKDNTFNFLSILIDKNRIVYFDAILEQLCNEIDELNNVTRVEIVSAVELTEEEKFNLKDKLQRKLSCNVSSKYIIDESIYAGLIIKIGDKVIDNSLKSRFENLKRQLM